MEKVLAVETKSDVFSKDCDQRQRLVGRETGLGLEGSFRDLGIPSPYSEILKLFSVF